MHTYIIYTSDLCLFMEPLISLGGFSLSLFQLYLCDLGINLISSQWSQVCLSYPNPWYYHGSNLMNLSTKYLCNSI